MGRIILHTTGGYDKEVIKEFNEVSKNFTSDEILEQILTSWADDKDIESITEHLKNK
jgi:hypothetical protein